jgi:hypothetical protein
MKDNALTIKTDSLLDEQPCIDFKTNKLTINNNSTNVNWRHSLEAQIEKLYSASIAMNLDTTQIAAQLDATRPSHNQLEIKL